MLKLRRLGEVGLVALVCWVLALVSTEAPTARPWGACSTLAISGYVRDVACGPLRCMGTLADGSASGYAFTVRSPVGGARWREGDWVTAALRVCR